MNISHLDLTSAAVEIDCYLRGKSFGFENLEKVKNFLKREQDSADDIIFFWKSFKKNSQKDYALVDEIRLEKKLMVYEIENIKSNPKDRAEEVMDVLCNMSQYIIGEKRRYLAA